MSVSRRPGEAVAAGPWRPGFFPLEGAVRSALIWVRLPWLPMKFWGEAALRGVLRLAGELSLVDDGTAERKRLGFARACVKLDLSRPLRPGVLIKGSEGPFWQRFV